MEDESRLKPSVMRSESESAEFEIECTSPFTGTPSRKRQRVLRPRPTLAESKVAGYYAPGGILDSQTTETQWILQYSDGQPTPANDNELFDDGGVISHSPSPPPSISYNNYILMQERKKATGNSSAGDKMPSTLVLTSDCTSTSSQDELLNLAVEITKIARKGVQDELDKVKQTCLNLEDEVRAVTARRDLMGQDLSREREWIRLLEVTLKTNSIPFPPYPFA